MSTDSANLGAPAHSNGVRPPVPPPPSPFQRSSDDMAETTLS